MWSSFFEDNRRYADIINCMGCDGEQVVSHTDLSELDTRAGSKIRDLVRKTAFGVNFAIIGIENQDEVDYALPVRIMNYDAAHYKKQVTQIGKRLKEEKQKLKAGEFLYGFQKRSRLFPVVTFVLYAGLEPWDGPRSLHEIIDFSDIPERIKELTQDYKIKIIDIRRLDDTSKLKTDVRYVFDFIRCAEDWDALLKLVNENPYYQNMDSEAYDLISKYANLKESAIKLEEYRREDGGIDMCKGIRDLMENSKAEGKEEGIELGEDKMKNQIVKNMIKKGMSISEICELAECDEKFVEQVRLAM